MPDDRRWEGFSLETLVYHELRVYNEVSRKQRHVYYYRTPAGVEVDFIIETSRRTAASIPHILAIEVKKADNWNRSWEKPLLSLESAGKVKVDRQIMVYAGERSYRFGPVQVLPFGWFCELLHKGEFLCIWSWGQCETSLVSDTTGNHSAICSGIQNKFKGLESTIS